MELPTLESSTSASATCPRVTRPRTGATTVVDPGTSPGPGRPRTSWAIPLRRTGSRRENDGGGVRCEDAGWGRSLVAAVPVVDPHDVIEFGGARLEDDGVLQGRHAVPSAGAEVHRLTGKQLE